MPRAIKKKVPKKIADTEAEVKDRLSGLKDAIRERQKTVLKYGAIILVALIAVLGFLLYDHTSRKKARVLEYEAYKVYHGDYQRQPVNREEQYKKALDMFKKAYDTRKSPTSLFYSAASYYELGRYDDALKTLKDFTQKYSHEEKFMPLVYQKMATIYIKKGNTEEAMKTLDGLYHLKGDLYKDFALMEYARLLEKGGKSEEAKKKYEELTTKFPNSPFSDEAKERR
jgi:predicted negative regulator of RcsB-dependent stress response